MTVMQKEKSQFRVNLQHDSLNGPALVKMANTYWQLSWIGQTGPLTGETIAGKTGWTTKHLLRFDTDGRAMYTDVNTRACAYSEEPHYFTTMLGDSHFHLIRSAIRNCAPTITLHCLLRNSHFVYNPTMHGFRVYLLTDKQKDGPALAQRYFCVWLINCLL